MWDLRVCVACLATDVRMYSMSAASLLEPYRLLTGIELQSDMPQKLCWECAALVHKFNMFRHKCERASLLLQDIYNQHDEISEEEVLRVNREQNNLISSCTICPIQVYNYQKTRESKTKSRKSLKDKTAEAEKINKSQTDIVPMESSVKVEIEIIKKEEVPIEIKSEPNDKELIDDTFVEEDSSQVVQLEPPRKKKRITKKRQQSKSKIKRKMNPGEFGMIEEILTQERQMEVLQEKQNAKAYKSARFPCTLCFNYFNEKKAFNNHMLKHDPVAGEFICDLCKMRYSSRRKMYSHIRSYHLMRYTCRLCPSVFHNRTTAIKHNYWHKGVEYTCRICYATFNRSTSYQGHLRLKHAVGHACDQCGEPFHSKKGLLCHINLSHKLKRDTVASGGEQETSGPYCAECDIQFTCKQAWTRHILISPKHQHERHICALGCKTCGETLPDKKSLRAHRVIHKPAKRVVTKKPSKCKKCKGCMEQQACEHATERRFMCDICSKTFTALVSLQIHIRTHTKELPYKCNICGRGFAGQSNFYRHKLVHTDAKPYACETCGKCFKYRETVKSHIDYVHMKKPWPKRNRSMRQNGSEQRSSDDIRVLLEDASDESTGNSVPVSFC